MVSIIKCRTNQIIHRGIHNKEMFLAGVFNVLDPGDQDTGVAGDKTAWFHENTQTERLEQRHKPRGVLCRCQEIFGRR